VRKIRPMREGAIELEYRFKPTKSSTGGKKEISSAVNASIE